MKIVIKTAKKRCVIDITDEISKAVEKTAGAVNVFAAHTTCAITAADLDPGTDQDLLEALLEIVPKLDYRHPHNPSHQHVASHIASSVIGPSITLPVKDGLLVLGQWQRVVLVELDGPRERTVIITNL